MNRLPESLGSQVKLSIKRDDQSHSLYGGNKVRKLEFTLPDIQARGSKRVISGGGLGSHMTIALAAFAKEQNIPVDVVLFKQPLNEHVKSNLRLNHYFGASMEYSRNYVEFALDIGKRFAAAAIKDKKLPYFIYPGDSNALSGLNPIIYSSRRDRGGRWPV